jgi:hypothetical protein
MTAASAELSLALTNELCSLVNQFGVINKLDASEQCNRFLSEKTFILNKIQIFGSVLYFNRKNEWKIKILLVVFSLLLRCQLAYYFNNNAEYGSGI